MSNPECHAIVKRVWEEMGGVSVEEKIKNCSRALSGWGAATFGDMKNKIKKKEEELQRWQSCTPDGVMLGKCRELVEELDDMHRL